MRRFAGAAPGGGFAMHRGGIAAWLWRALGGVLALCAAAALAWLGGFAWFVAGSTGTTADNAPPTDAIVVLTGGSQRLESGLDLLRAGKGRMLFVTGVSRGVPLETLLRVSGNAPAWAICCVELGHEAKDTLDNALETARWMRQHGFKSLRLVTAWYHMRRSLLEFDRVMPGTEILAAPVFPQRAKPDHWWEWHGTLLLLIREYDKYLGTLLRPLAGGLRLTPPAGERRGAEVEQ
jgi:uncharacterized SAM-binding protein YcdF (DUF218 family)